MKAGDRVLDYLVELELGEGGMGKVYLARHTTNVSHPEFNTLLEIRFPYQKISSGVAARAFCVRSHPLVYCL
jgi:hypothetical protein